MTLVIKTNGTKQHYDSRKVYGSIYAACFVTGMAEERCAKIAAHVSKVISDFLKSRAKITARWIAQRAAQELRKFSKEAAFMYATHREVG